MKVRDSVDSLVLVMLLAKRLVVSVFDCFMVQTDFMTRGAAVHDVQVMCGKSIFEAIIFQKKASF